MRARFLILLSAVVLTTLVGTTPALADDDEGPTTSSSIPEEGIGIDQGLFVSGAVVTELDGGAERTMSEYEAAVFLQSFVAAGYYGGEEIIKDPPTGTPVYRIDFSGTWVGQEGNVTAYYTTDGETPFVSFPGFAVWTDPAAIPPPGDWFTPPDRVIDAFNGEAELVETGGIDLATSVPTVPEEAAGDADEDGSDPPWVWIVVGAAVALALIGAFTLRRRAAVDEPADEPVDEPV